MATEIERKFLVGDISFLAGVAGVRYRQGFLSTEPGRTIRVRVGGDKAFLTVKGPVKSLSRAEFEYPIPVADAQQILDQLCQKPLIEKVRYKIPFAGVVWEVDVFEGENAGLVVAEVELESESQQVELPAWVGQEVTGDRRYYNSQLVAHPYRTWV